MYAYEINGCIDLSPTSKTGDAGAATLLQDQTNGINETKSNAGAYRMDLDKRNDVKMQQNESDIKNTTPIKSKNKSNVRHLKMPFRKSEKPLRTRIIEVASKSNQNGSVSNHNNISEVPGIVNTSFSSEQTKTNNFSSVELACESTHHGLVVAMHRKMVCCLLYNFFVDWCRTISFIFKNKPAAFTIYNNDLKLYKNHNFCCCCCFQLQSLQLMAVS